MHLVTVLVGHEIIEFRVVGSSPTFGFILALESSSLMLVDLYYMMRSQFYTQQGRNFPTSVREPCQLFIGRNEDSFSFVVLISVRKPNRLLINWLGDHLPLSSKKRRERSPASVGFIDEGLLLTHHTRQGKNM